MANGQTVALRPQCAHMAKVSCKGFGMPKRVRLHSVRPALPVSSGSPVARSARTSAQRGVDRRRILQRCLQLPAELRDEPPPGVTFGAVPVGSEVR